MLLRKAVFGALLAVFCLSGPATDATAQSGDLLVRIELLPIETLRLADFDPVQPSASPVVFRVFLTAGTQTGPLRVEVDVESESFGFLGIASLDLGSVGAGQSVMLTNQDFDTYELGDAGNMVVELATERGVLPPDDYYFVVRVIDLETGGEVGTDTAVITTTNSGTQIELVGPGTPLDQEPDLIPTPYPVFQWFSDATRFDFTLYEVQPDQSSAEDIVASLPVFEQSDVAPGTFVYPNAAEELISGRRYAWQIEAISRTSSGDERFPSEMRWFVVEDIDNPLSEDEDGAQLPTVRLQVEPQEAIVATNESAFFEADVQDLNDMPVFDQVPVWTVVPEHMGSVDENGVFTAGSQSGVAAIVATIGDSEDFASVEIVDREGSGARTVASKPDIQLVAPVDGQIVLEPEPTFAWHYRGPDSSTVASFLLSVRKGGDSFDVALPIWELEHVGSSTPYPPNEELLEPGATYFVRVAAIDSAKSTVAASEPVSFAIEREDKLSYELQGELDAARTDNRDSTLVRVVLRAGTNFVDPSLMDALEEIGATLELIEGPWVQISIPYSNLSDLAALDLVDFVSLPAPHAYLAAPELALGEEALDLSPVKGIPAGDSRFAPVDIAVFEFGFDPAAIKELLPDANVRFYSFRADERIGGTGPADSRHATAVVRALGEHLPPNATIHLVNFDTEPEFHHALDYVVHELNVGVITCSVSWANAYDYYDGSSYFSRRIAQLLGTTTPLVAAAGNFAESHWQAPYGDSDADGIHDFDPFAEMLEVKLVNGRFYNFLLSWNDWGGDPRVDLDIELYNAAGELLLDRRGRPYASRSVQGPTEYAQPVERIRAFRPIYPGTRSYYVKVFRKRGTPDPAARGTEFELYVSPPPEGATPGPVASSSLASGLVTTDSRSVIPVGANDLTHSSRGPTNDGRIRPDFSADGTVEFGEGRIRGTSFAAPRVATALALIVSRHPGWGVEEAYDYLRRFSVQPDGTPGKNARFGWGQVDIEALVEALTQ